MRRFESRILPLALPIVLASAALGACTRQTPFEENCDPVAIARAGQVRTPQLLFVRDGANVRSQPSAAITDPAKNNRIGQVMLSSPDACVVVIPQPGKKIATSADNQGKWYGMEVAAYALSGIALEAPQNTIAWVNEQRAVRMCFSTKNDNYTPCP